MQCLTKYLIQTADGPAYRSGNLDGMRHPAVDGKMIRAAGGMKKLLEGADELEKAGLIRTERKKLGADIVRIHYPVSAVPELCRRAGVEDPRERQLRWIRTAGKWAGEAEGTFLEPYYEVLLQRLAAGQDVKKPDMEDEDFFRCLNRAAAVDTPVWRRQFSKEVLHDSKLFEKKYQDKVVTVLDQYSPLVEEGMTADDILRVHGIKTYSQTLEWKGSLIYRIGNGSPIDSSVNIFGTVINAQTLEQAVPSAAPGIRRIMLIENKANYESMDFRADTLYIYCHGFFSPKEIKFLGALTETTVENTEYLHWGDMDLGGIRIFLYNQKRLFPKLKPYRMDGDAYADALAAGAGISLEKEKKEKLQKLDAGCMENLKELILENEMEIEQESLLFAEKQGSIKCDVKCEPEY